MNNDPKTGKFLPGNKAAVKHGAFSDVRIESIRRKVRKAKAGWIRDIGPYRGDLTTSQRILIEKASFLLERTLCLEAWLSEQGERALKPLKDGQRDYYLAWANSLRLILRELGIDRRVGARKMTEDEFLDQFDYGPQSGAKEKGQ